MKKFTQIVFISALLLTLFATANAQSAEAEFEKDFDKVLLILEGKAKPPKTPNDYILYAVAYFSQGQKEKAFEAIDKALKLKPNFGKAYTTRSFFKIRHSDIEGALEDIDMAIQVQPDFTPAYFQRAMLKRDRQYDLDGALSDFDEAIKRGLNTLDVFLERGSLKYKKSDYDGAISDFSQVLKLKPALLTAFIHRSFAKRDKGDLDGAISDLKSLIEYYEKSSEEERKATEKKYAQKPLSNSKGNKRNSVPPVRTSVPDIAVSSSAPTSPPKREPIRVISKEEKAAQFRRWTTDYSLMINSKIWVEVDIGDGIPVFAFIGETDISILYYHISNLNIKKKDEVAALNALNKAIEAYAENFLAHFAKGKLLSKQNHLDEAIESLNKAIELDSSSPEFYAERGITFLLFGKDEDAQKDFDSCLKLSPNMKPELEKRIEEAKQKSQKTP